MHVQVSSSSIRQGFKDPLDIQATVLFSPTSSGVSGTGLWSLEMYGSQNADGTGPQFQRVLQVLSQAQQDQPQESGRIEFVNAYGEMDVTAIGCGEYNYLCFDFKKGDNPRPEFAFASLQQPDSSKFTVCSRRSCSQTGGLFSFSIYYLLKVHGSNVGIFFFSFSFKRQYRVLLH